MPARQIAAGGTRGTVFAEAARLRFADADVLFNCRRFSGAVYLAGYAIECHLKYAYCELKSQTYLPGHLETHRWEKLKHAAGLDPAFAAQEHRKMKALFDALVETWSENLRYNTKSLPEREGTRLYNEMRELYKFIQELAP